jgi:hypothetical protein
MIWSPSGSGRLRVVEHVDSSGACLKSLRLGLHADAAGISRAKALQGNITKEVACVKNRTQASGSNVTET